MNKTESRLPLLDNDYLENESSGESSSGYESSDSFGSSLDLRPAPEGRQDSTQGHVMIFKSTSELQDSLAFILSMPNLCDVTFLVGKEHTPVHGVKAVLATRSRCLYQLILHHQRQMEAEQNSKKKSKKQKRCVGQKLLITVMDYAVDDFRNMINYLHTGKVKVDTSSVVGLLCAAYEFGQESLYSACKEFIRRCHGDTHRNSIITSARHYMHKKPARRILMELS